MFFHSLTTALLGTTVAAAAAITTTTTSTLNPSTLNVTVIAAHNNKSTLECWALEPGFESSNTPGTTGNPVLSLGAPSANISYMAIPPRTDGGLHNAPTIQWVSFVSGKAHVTLPHSDDEAWVTGGEFGTILAIDTEDVSADGHFTEYPSDEVTVALAMPVKEVPGHRVLHAGACTRREQKFL
ncbi:hypothetical protein BDV25DRAFT_160379 [Aspergillus avenaceus]|uniref:Small secreted protein n=1 Tax=Aspergillus avenaceus TaxID=36643 RepID=A0A5N6TM36_ASPAV|nr:hypothetical protein BDV25DRAFT_160379 [Aspergillus avenaceus]